MGPWVYTYTTGSRSAPVLGTGGPLGARAGCMAGAVIGGQCPTVRRSRTSTFSVRGVGCRRVGRWRWCWIVYGLIELFKFIITRFRRFHFRRARRVTGKHVRVESSKEETILAFWQTEHKQKSGQRTGVAANRHQDSCNREQNPPRNATSCIVIGQHSHSNGGKVGFRHTSTRFRRAAIRAAGPTPLARSFFTWRESSSPPWRAG